MLFILKRQIIVIYSKFFLFLCVFIILFSIWKHHFPFSISKNNYIFYLPLSGYVCNGLFSISEDDFRTRRMTRFCKLFGRYQNLATEISQFKDHSCITTQNLKADSLARSVRTQPSFVIRMDAKLSI